MADLDTLRSEVRSAIHDLAVMATLLPQYQQPVGIVRAELLRLAGEVVRLSEVESRETEQRLQMEDVELYLMDVSQPDDEDADWRDRMKSAIELLVQDCNYAVGQKNKAEAELAAIKARIAEAPVGTCDYDAHLWLTVDDADLPCEYEGQRVRLLVEE